jgi:hypothetical protein
MKLILATIALALALATPALAQSTVVMPLPGASGYAFIPPRRMADRPAGGSGPQHVAVLTGIASW